MVAVISVNVHLKNWGQLTNLPVFHSYH